MKYFTRDLRYLLAMSVAVMSLATPHTYAQTDTPSLESLAEQIQVLTQAMQALQETVDSQQDRIRELEEENDGLRSPSSDFDAVAVNSTKEEKRKLELGAVVDLVGTSTESHDDINGNDRRSVRDLELILGGPIDSLTRFDATLSFSDVDDDVEIEEAYVTYADLLLGWSARIGRIRPAVGIIIPLHRDALDTVDEPLVIQRYLGDKGFFRTGLEVSRSLPQLSDRLTHQIVGGIVEGGIGDGGSMFGDVRRHPTFYGRLHSVWEASDSTSIEFGGTGLLGSATEEHRSDVQALALDAAYLFSFSPERRLKIQSEFFMQNRDDAVPNDDPAGYYGLLDYRVNAKWALGGRYDNVELVEIDSGEDKAYSAYLTFFQSKFARWRLQYQHVDFASGGDDNVIFVQGTFSLGETGRAHD
ncbi:MAG: hypothetical protein VCD00_12020 [Candidatus Hydrogenedentota bacterium]